jgi:hypothetical protein
VARIPNRATRQRRLAGHKQVKDATYYTLVESQRVDEETLSAAWRRARLIALVKESVKMLKAASEKYPPIPPAGLESRARELLGANPALSWDRPLKRRIQPDRGSLASALAVQSFTPPESIAWIFPRPRNNALLYI